MQTIGKRIKAVRDSFDISQKAFGARIGVSQTTLTALENDKNEPSMGTFNKIVDEFKVNPEWLRTGQGEMKVSLRLPADPAPPIPSASPLSIVQESELVKDLKDQNRELREQVKFLQDLMRSGADFSKLAQMSFNLGNDIAAEQPTLMWAA
jgi:transcriptional regulator with XRE-family HTH domain